MLDEPVGRLGQHEHGERRQQRHQRQRLRRCPPLEEVARQVRQQEPGRQRDGLRFQRMEVLLKFS